MKTILKIIVSLSLIGNATMLYLIKSSWNSEKDLNDKLEELNNSYIPDLLIYPIVPKVVEGDTLILLTMPYFRRAGEKYASVASTVLPNQDVEVVLGPKRGCTVFEYSTDSLFTLDDSLGYYQIRLEATVTNPKGQPEDIKRKILLKKG